MGNSALAQLSTTAASNTTIGGVSVAESCAMSNLNNGIRALAAAAVGALTFPASSGTDTYTATLAPAPDAYTNDFLYCVNIGNANTSTTPTLNLNSLGAKTITGADGGTLAAGNLHGRHIFAYDGTNMRVLNPIQTSSLSDATNGGINVSGSTGAITIKQQPSDLLTKSSRSMSDSISIMDAAASNVAKTMTFPNALSGMPIQRAAFSTVGLGTGTTVLPVDDTIPQNTEGDQYLSVAITPTNSSSTLYIDAVLECSSSVSGYMSAALFQDSTAGALAAITTDIGFTTDAFAILTLRHKMTAGTTSATTFKVRAGLDRSGTMTVNGQAGGRLFGGVMNASIIVTEVLP